MRELLNLAIHKKVAFDVCAVSIAAIMACTAEKSVLQRYASRA